MRAVLRLIILLLSVWRVKSWQKCNLNLCNDPRAFCSNRKCTCPLGFVMNKKGICRRVLNDGIRSRIDGGVSLIGSNCMLTRDCNNVHYVCVNRKCDCAPNSIKITDNCLPGNDAYITSKYFFSTQTWRQGLSTFSSMWQR